MLREKCKEILDHEIQEDVWQRSTHSEEEPFGRKVKERIPKEMGAEAILSVHRERMRRERSMPSLIHKSGEVELREGRTREVRTHDSILTVNPKENVDHRFGPGEFAD